ncbi:MAG TPA: hypothetical protein PLJ84_11665 [Bacteroidales bacterium]|nr:hypothetical protein [Bacteroidales bacterium]
MKISSYKIRLARFIIIVSAILGLNNESSAQDIFQLPFNEGWTSGNFTLNNWQAGANWIIDGQQGSPEPAAKFKWDPTLTNYNSYIESWWLDDSSTNTTTYYSIWLDFDVKLSDRTSSGTETMRAEVLKDSSWVVVAEFVNDSNFNWISKHIRITNKVRDKAFKIRFTASGASSSEIYYWSVDNIHVYRDFPLSPPVNFDATLLVYSGGAWNDMYLTWSPPVIPDINPVWIHWDDGTNADAIGTGGPADFDIAARFDISQIEQYEGMSVTKIAFWPNEATCQYSLRVWKGDNAASLLADQVVSNPAIGEWNEVELNPPVPIDVSEELWFGVRCNTPNGYPAGCDNGPEIRDYGQWMFWEGTWQNLADLNSSLTFNWNLQAYLEQMDDSPQKQSSPVISETGRGLNTGPVHLQPVSDTGSLTENNLTKHTRDIDAPDAFLGYNIYRRSYIWPYTSTLTEWTKINDTPVSETYYWDLNLPRYCYSYYVTASYTEGESVPSNIDYDNYWCTNDMTEKDADAAVISPVPASDYLRIDDPVGVKGLLMYNSKGEIITQQKLKGEHLLICDVSQYSPGMYFIMIERINSEISLCKILIAR